MKIATVLFLVVAACGGGATAGSSACLTKGATYLIHYIQAANGTCGAIPDTIVNIDSNGKAIGADKLKCDDASIDGCTIKNTNCVNTVDQTTCTTTTSVEYTKDGASGGGLATISCVTGTTSCLSTYEVTAARQ